MKRLQLLVMIVLTACLFQQCSRPKPDENASEAKTFSMNDTLLKQIRIDTVKNENVTSELKLTGKITFNQDKLADIFPLVGGHVKEVKAQLGDYVNKGEVLAVIRSGDMAGFTKDYISAQSAFNAAKKNLEVMEDMYKTGLNSEKEYTQARSDFESAQAELARVKEVKKIYGDNREGDYQIKAPVSGFVVKKNITEDMEIRTDNSNQLFTISDLSKVWILANVYETDIDKIELGYDADVTTISYPGQVFHGKIDKIFNVLDPDSKVMKIRVVLDNKNYMLKPEMFATVTIRFHGNEKRLSIPAESVILDKNKNYVMVYTDRNHIQPREVQIYKVNKDRAYIGSGLNEGERIISRYQLLVYNAITEQ